jgi:hypothetical protein
MGGFTEGKTTLTLKCAIRTASLNEWTFKIIFNEMRTLNWEQLITAEKCKFIMIEKLQQNLNEQCSIQCTAYFGTSINGHQTTFNKA